MVREKPLSEEEYHKAEGITEEDKAINKIRKDLDASEKDEDLLSRLNKKADEELPFIHRGRPGDLNSGKTSHEVIAEKNKQFPVNSKIKKVKPESGEMKERQKEVMDKIKEAKALGNKVVNKLENLTDLNAGVKDAREKLFRKIDEMMPRSTFLTEHGLVEYFNNVVMEAKNFYDKHGLKDEEIDKWAAQILETNVVKESSKRDAQAGVKEITKSVKHEYQELYEEAKIVAEYNRVNKDDWADLTREINIIVEKLEEPSNTDEARIVSYKIINEQIKSFIIKHRAKKPKAEE
ncbi:MAG: hypothetical protein V1838_00735 [Patescibacteria group bacterium]